MGALSTIQGKRLEIKAAIRSALESLATTIDVNTAGIATNTAWIANNVEIETLAANRILTAADSGKTFLCNLDNLVVSLPATAKGLRYRFISIKARTTAKASISPVAADGISGSTSATTNVVIAGVVDKDIINTKTTQEVGDAVEILGTGATGTGAWIIINSTGIWAAEG